MVESSTSEIVHYGNGHYKSTKVRCGEKSPGNNIYSVTLEVVDCTRCIQIVIAEKAKLIVVSIRHKTEWEERLRSISD